MVITCRAEIEKIQKILENRQAKLYHACQLQDFYSYIELGGIPSRNKLLESGLDFTEFDTDENDKENDLWDKVFGNFSDFGSNFAREGSNSFPNPYGPIQIVINPSATKDFNDIAISLRSAGASDFDRDSETLSSSKEFEKIYLNPQIKQDNSDKLVAYQKTLNERFGRTNCTSPEFNCTISDELIPFSRCAYITVDNCDIGGESLLSKVQKSSTKKVFLRNYYGNKGELILELSKLTQTYDCNKRNLLNNPAASRELKQLITAMNEFHYNRFVRYLTIGTTRL